jgi:hypothetical protein
VEGSSWFFSRAAIPARVRTWRTVRLVGADSPHGTGWPRVLRVRRVFLSVFVSIRLVVWFWPEEVCRTVRIWVADRPREGRTIRPAVADRPRGTSCSWTVRGPGTDYPRGWVLV